MPLFSRTNASVPSKPGSSSEIKEKRTPLLARLKEWKSPELKFPKLSQPSSPRISTKGKYPQVAAPKHVSPKNHSSEESPPSPHLVAGSSSLASVPQEHPSFSISDSLSLFDLSSANAEPVLPSVQDSKRHSSSSSEYGPSYRSRSSSGPSMYGGSDPSYPYALRFASLESVLLKSEEGDAQPLERQSSGSWCSISPPTPELGSPPPTHRDPLNQFQAEANVILERFLACGAHSPPKNDKGLPILQTKESRDISTRRRAAVTDPFPFPLVEDSDDEGVIAARSRVQGSFSFPSRGASLPFSSPIIEDDWHEDAPQG